MHRTVQDAMARLDADEAFAELRSQAERVRVAGLSLVCCDNHMGPVCPEACRMLCGHLDVPFLYPFVEPHVAFTSSVMLSPYEGNPAYPDKKAWLLNHLGGLAPGVHYLCTHPAVAGAELSAIARSDARNVDWAERFRRSDLEVLTDPDVCAEIQAHGIELVCVADLATP
jgi:hypothetical protein